MEHKRTEGGRHECKNKCAGSLYLSNQKAAAQDKDSTKAKLTLSCKLEIMNQVTNSRPLVPVYAIHLLLPDTSSFGECNA